MAEGTVLLTIGRLPVALDLARSFHAAGWRVVVAEPLGMHMCRMSRVVDRCRRVTAPREDPARYLDDLRRVVREESVDLVVPTSEEAVHACALAGDPGGPRLFAMPQAHTLALHDKQRFAALAADAGLRVPRTAAIDAADAVRIAGDGAFVVKPRHSCSGRGVRSYPRGHPLPRAHGCVVQAHVEGPVHSTLAIAHGGELAANVTYRAAVTSGSVAVAFERVDADGAVARWVRTFVERTRHTGFVAFDFVIDAGGEPWAIECNPRATSGIHFLDAGALAPAVVGAARECPLRPERLLAESYSCFTAALGEAGRPRRLLHALRRLREARDVTWSRGDPWPFLLMTVNTWPILARAIAQRRTFAEVAVLDVEWREPRPA